MSQCSGLAELAQRRVGARDPDALAGPGRADRDVAGVAAEAALELRGAERDQAARGGDAVEVVDALGLGEAVVHEPVLALQRRRGVRVERLVAVEQDVALEVQELQRGERDAGEVGVGGELLRLHRVGGPALGPVRADHDDRAGRDAAVPLLPRADVGDGEEVLRVLGDLGAVLMTTSGRTE